MEIIVNGKNQVVDDALKLQAYIEKACANPSRVIAELNEKIVKREEWKNVALKQGDRVELVTFVGGG